jgi:hypothetical protein
MIYLLNSPILTSYGSWRFEGPLELDKAKNYLSGEFTSAIGHEGAASFLSALLGIQIIVNRVAINMQEGDSALVLRLKTRLTEGAVLDAQALKDLPYELSLLTKLSN